MRLCAVTACLWRALRLGNFIVQKEQGKPFGDVILSGEANPEGVGIGER